MAASQPQGGSPEIRLAESQDAAFMAALATQLGYPSSPEDVAKRLALIPHDGDHAVLVAVLGGRVVAWVHAYVCHLVESDTQVEIGGLVVDQNCRGRGVGRGLMERAEEWARTKGCKVVFLRSNIIRGEAHRFYKSLGYTHVKTQHAFRKIV